MSEIMKFENLQDRIIEIRNQKVLLDIDVAEIYGVETKRINEAVKNNPDKFPSGYIIELEKIDWDRLKSKFSTSIKGGKVKLPTAFPEKGLYMLATILKSQQAVQTTLAIIETFAKIRQLSKSIKELSAAKDKTNQKALMQRSGELIAGIFDDDLQTNGTETSIDGNDQSGCFGKYATEVIKKQLIEAKREAIAKRAKTAMASSRKKMTTCGTVKELYKDLESD